MSTEAAPARFVVRNSALPKKTRRVVPTAELKEILTELGQYRELLYQFTLRDVKIRYKQAAMGFAWALFMPAVIVLAGLLVRFAMAQFSGTPLDTSELSGVAVKSVPWAFFVGAIQFATNSLAANKTLVAKVYFPRELLPLASVITQAFDSTVGGVALAVVLVATGLTLSLTTLWLLPLLLLLGLVTAAAALMFSCANLFFRDVKYIVQIGVTFGIFFTPVFLNANEFGVLGSQLIMLNPLAPILEGIRLAVVEHHNLLEPLIATTGVGSTVLVWDPIYLLYSAVLGVGGVVLTSLWFHRLEFLFAEFV